jgi:hypothetical protein
MTEPLYRHIEFCRNAETLWGKLQSGTWDWLGVHPDGKFVLGSPAANKGFQIRAAATVVQLPAEEGEHGVVTHTPHGLASAIWCPTEEAAKHEFQRLRDLEEAGEGPRLLRLRRVEGGRTVEEDYVVRNPSTYR